MGHSSSKPQLECSSLQRTSSQLAVIIPTLNEANNIGATIESVRVLDIRQRYQPEVLVVDGGSSDDTVAIAKQAGCKVLQTGPGRGHQMNAGWQATSRAWCLFLHGDSQLPPGYLNALNSVVTAQQTLRRHDGCLEHNKQQRAKRRWWHRNTRGNSPRDTKPQDTKEGLAIKEQKDEVPFPGCQQQNWFAKLAEKGCEFFQTPPTQYHSRHSPLWGCFNTIHTDWAHTCRGQILSGGVALRTRLCGLPYGDQGIFVARHVLEKVGGLPDWPLLEDVELVRRCKQVCGQPPHILPLAIRTSGRRWEKLGFWRTAFINQAILLGWSIGIPPHQLAEWYYTAKTGNRGNHDDSDK